MRILALFLVLGGLGFFLFSYIADYFPISSYPTCEIHSYAQIQEKIPAWGEGTVVFFDIDHTLIETFDPLGAAYRWPLQLWVRVLWRHPAFIRRSIWKKYNSIMWGQAPRFVVEPEVITSINTLKEQGCLVFGLTGIDADDYGLIKSVPQWRFAMLAALGITFSQTCGDLVLHALPEYAGVPPRVYKGIVFADYETKGEVLKEFLKACNLHPKRIVCFDNARRTLYKIGSVCTELGIQCDLYRYSALRQPLAPIDSDQILARIDELVACECWVD